MDHVIKRRKSPRLRYFDYSSSSYYFITICTNEHKCFFGKVDSTPDNGKMTLNAYGKITERHIQEIVKRKPNIMLDKYVIMPNHVHMILSLNEDSIIPLSQIVGSFKAGVSREIGFSVWQRSFYDHIIRSEADYKRICEYIENNPAKWALDKYYTSEIF